MVVDTKHIQSKSISFTFLNIFIYMKACIVVNIVLCICVCFDMCVLVRISKALLTMTRDHLMFVHDYSYILLTDLPYTSAYKMHTQMNNIKLSGKNSTVMRFWYIQNKKKHLQNYCILLLKRILSGQNVYCFFFC